MSRLDVRRFEPGDGEQWNALVDRSRARHFLFRREYMTYHADRYEDFSLLVHVDGRLLAALPATSNGDEVISHGGLTFGGLIGDETLTARRTVEVLGAVLDFLRAHEIRRLVYKPVPHIYHVVPAEEDLYALFVHGARLVRRDISSTLRPGQALPRTKGRRSAVRQARGAGLTLAESERFAEFMVLEAQALGVRHGVGPVHTPAELELLARHFPDNITLVATFRECEMLAGVVIYETDVVAHAQYIGASSEGYALHALDLIIDHLITERYRDKRFFDFGISTVDQGRILNEGLIRNKESFGARATVYDAYELVL
jgi:hypothetical protein